MAKAIFEGMSGKFVPSEYKDEYRQKVQDAIERKIAGKEIVAPKENVANSVSNLMDALKNPLSLHRSRNLKRLFPRKQQLKRRKRDGRLI